MKIPLSPPPLKDLFANVETARLSEVLLTNRRHETREYWHWDQIRHRNPPGDLTLEEWWLGIKMSRISTMRELPLRNRAGKPFTFCTPDELLELTHRVDRDASGQVELSEEVANPDTRDRYIISSLIEEAVTSSQLEGAATTRRVAVDMLRSGRKPRTLDERMIANNYQAMQYIRDMRHAPLTKAMILELHSIVMADTLDDPANAGRLQQSGEQRVHVWDNASGKALHIPPPAEQLPQRLQDLCAFANGESEVEGFLHPLLRAIVLHFWLAYDHPFVDGNGRVARALFYWSMLSQGYWLTEFLSISRLLKKAPAQYARSFLYSETDDNDLTYFLIAQLRLLVQAIDELKKHLRRKMREVRQVDALLQYADDMNYRQRALLAHAMRRPRSTYSIASHGRSHNVAYATARSDLLKLARAGFLEQRRAGRRFVFIAPADLTERISRDTRIKPTDAKERH